MGKKRVTRDELREKAMIDLTKQWKPTENAFYSSPEWRKLKKWYKKQHPLCELCLKEGRETPSLEVHHITPISQGGSALSVDNLIALCKSCHSDMHSIGVRISLDMLFSPDPWQVFKTKVVGITDKNPDGTDRQEIIPQCRRGETLKLVREPNNPSDHNYIGVFRESGEQIGYIDEKVARYSLLAYYMDHGCEVTVTVFEITGGPGNYGCVIEITRGDLNWEEAHPYWEKDREARDVIRKAESLETSDPDRAVFLYQKAMQILNEIDQGCREHIRPWRYERYPINRLTLLLEKSKKFKECLEQIEKYELMEDKVGLTKRDIESVHKRKARIIKKASKTGN